jgi:hypothetical protein
MQHMRRDIRLGVLDRTQSIEARIGYNAYNRILPDKGAANISDFHDVLRQA